jgi:hypothetical protein
MDDRTGAEKNPEKTARKVAKDLAPADPAAIMDPRMWAIHVTATGEISCATSQSNRLAECLEGARVETVPDAANFGPTSIYTEAMGFAVQRS